MTALTKDRNTKRRDGETFDFPVSAGKRIFAGAMVAIQADGYVAPGRTATGLRGVGVANEAVNNLGGSDGVVSVEVRRGCFAMKQDADPVSRSDIGNVCYMVDDQTVAKTNGANTRSPAGVVRDVVDGTVWVEF